MYHFALFNLSKISSILGIGKGYWIVIAFNFLKSTQKRFEPSGLGTKTTGADQGLVDGRIMFAFNNAAISVLIISFSERDFRYGRERIGLSELTLIVCSDIKHGSFKSSKDQANADLLSSSINLSFSKTFHYM